MKWFIGFILVALAATLTGLLIIKDPGYVLLAYQQWTIEMPLWLAILGLLLTIVLLRFILHLLGSIIHFKRNATRWYQQRRREKVRRYMNKGMLAYALEDWPQAEQYLAKAIARAHSPLVNYLAAAQAAQQQHAEARRDQYLDQASTAHPEAQQTVQFIKARAQLADHRYSAALITLNHLPADQRQHPRILALLLQIYQEQGEWRRCAQLLPVIKTKRALTDAAYQRTELMVMQQLLRQATAADDQGAQLARVWQTLSPSLQREPLLVAEYVQGLHRYQDMDGAEQCLRSSIKYHPANNVLIRLYGLTHSSHLARQFSAAKDWHDSDPNNAMILLTLGRLAKYNKLWGQAREYFIESLELLPQADTYLELADLLDQLGETTLAHQYYRDGLAHVVQ
jgi:HemY protein